jgi:cytoskeletal protein RodZ
MEGRRMEPSKKLSPAIVGIIVVVLIGLGTAGVIALNNNKEATPQTAQSTETSGTNQPATPSTTTSSQYKDGTYAATGSYATPGGQESVDLEVKLMGDTVQSIELTQNAITGEAKDYQARFASGYKSMVVGKSIDEISLSRVAGSSLTSAGFNDAIDQIKNDAAA